MKWTQRNIILTFFILLSQNAPAIASNIDYRYFLAGGTSAAISHGITTPIDVVKTRMQSDPSKYKSLVPATATIIKEEGAGALVKGLGPTLVGYGIEGAMKFGIYEVSKPLVLSVMAALSANLRIGKGGGNKGMSFLLASIAAGAVASLILVPMESTRIRMVTDPEFEGVGLVGGLARLIEEAGLIKTLTVGLGAMLAKQVPYTFGKQVSFDVFAKFFYGFLNAPRKTAYSAAVSSDSPDSTTTLSEILSTALSPEFVKWAVSVVSAMLASLMACVMSQPGDVILTETYKGGEKGNADKRTNKASDLGVTKKRNLSEVSCSVYSRHSDDGVIRGLSGFFTGLQARIVHVGLIITSQLVIYDLMKQLLGLPATGSH
ncbi:hypothetical protein ACHAXS_006222 [Conticribra weissflogii]